MPQSDPGAFERALKKLLAENEPLVEGRAQAVLGEELGRSALATPAVTTSMALVGGLMRLSPFVIDTKGATWQGAVAYDFRTLTIDARGTLSAKAAPADWTGAPPSIGLSWRGPLTAPVRDIDIGPFRNGLATIVLKRELEKIEAFEKAAAERQRQIEIQEAERRRKAAEEAARLARLKDEADRARSEAERIQNEQRSQGAPTGTSPFSMTPPRPPVDNQPPAAAQPMP
jgi:hypothetical protein